MPLWTRRLVTGAFMRLIQGPLYCPRQMLCADERHARSAVDLIFRRCAAMTPWRLVSQRVVPLQRLNDVFASLLAFSVVAHAAMLVARV